MLREGRPVATDQIRAATGRIVELAVPFAVLGAQPDQSVQFYVELLQGLQSRDRAPREGTIQLTCPTPEFEQIMWDV